MPFITVCTATYNFKPFIHRVYESLQTQSFKDFEWIVVDDGSEDDTESLIREWMDTDNFFPIRYFKFPENRGKMAATNHGLQQAQGEFFLDIGGDDALKPFALERLAAKWAEVDEDLKPEIAALITNLEDQHGNPVGDEFPSDPLVCDYFEKTFKYRIKGDKCQLYKTSVLREYPYYDHIDRHVPHSATYFDIAFKYKLYCFNDSLYIYFRNEAEKISLSQRTRKLRFLKGRQFYAELRINKFFDHIPSNKFKFFTFVSYIRYSRHIGLSFFEMIRRIQKVRYRIAFLFIYPIGQTLVISDRIKKRV